MRQEFSINEFALSKHLFLASWRLGALAACFCWGMLMSAEQLLTGVVLETSSACQLDCPYCSLRSYPERPDPAVMPLSVVEAVAPYLAEFESIDLTGWGEPLKNPELFPIIETVRRTFTGRLSMTTNGLLLERQRMERLIEFGLDTICISVDAASERSYKLVRPGGNFKRLRMVMEDFESLKGERRSERPDLFATFLLRRDALQELPDFVGMVTAHGLTGVVLQQLTGIFNDAGMSQATHSGYYHNPFEQAELDEAIARAKEATPPGFIIVGPENVYAERQGHCGVFDLSRAFVTAAGDVSACCAMAYPCSFIRRDGSLEKTPAVTFGNVRERPLPEIYNDPAYVRAREQIRSGEIPDACGDCIALYMEPGEAWTNYSGDR